MMTSMKVGCCVTLAAALPSWEEYKTEHGLSFNGPEDDARQAIFNDNLANIINENLKGNTYWLTATKFTHLDNDEFRTLIKGTKSTPFSGKASPHTLTGVAAADRKDWREESGVVTPVKDQGSCGSCWAFSAVETLESHLAIATGTTAPKLSAQQIVSCSPNPQHCGGTGGCDGSTQPLAFAYTKTAGITTESNYPYTARTGSCSTSKIKPVAHNSGHTELKVNDYNELFDAIANVGPVSISIAAGGFAFQFYGGGVLSNCNDYVMDHAVQLVGYGTDGGKDYWLVRNSWGSWGESGYIRMQRHGDGNEPCGTDSKPQDGDACEGDTTPRTYCGECGILSSSSYPTGMSAAATLSSTDVDCSQAACPDQCQCGLDKCADSINTCLADATCAKGQDCAMACPCSDTACELKCAAANPSAKALPVATCLNKNCAAVVV